MRMSPDELGTTVHDVGVVLVGERHGTNEFPELVSTIARAAAPHGSFVVGLELPNSAQEATRAYLRSNGDRDARDTLVAHRAWQGTDGRASQAVFRLLEQVRQLGADGASVDIALFDALTSADPRGADWEIRRDRAMAQSLLRCADQCPVVALTGNVHAALVPRSGLPSQFEPAAALIAQHRPVLSLLGQYSSGASWCTLALDGKLVAGVHEVVGQDRGDGPFIDLDDPPDGYHGAAYVGRITPSPPISGR